MVTGALRQASLLMSSVNKLLTDMCRIYSYILGRPAMVQDDHSDVMPPTIDPKSPPSTFDAYINDFGKLSRIMSYAARSVGTSRARLSTGADHCCSASLYSPLTTRRSWRSTGFS